MNKLICLISIALIGSVAHAATSRSVDTNKLWSESRVFVMLNKLSSSPSDFNALTSPDSVHGLSSITGFGLEGNFNVGTFMKAGLRAGGWWTKQSSSVTSNSNAYLAIQQGWGGAILRFPFVRTDLLQVDVFGEGGLATTHIDVSTTSSGAGTFKKSFSPYERAGLSAGVGWTKFYVFVEGGYQWQKLDTMSYTGSLTTSISSIDLSGTYVGFGFIVNGIPGSSGK